jgi:hypothetical protein
MIREFFYSVVDVISNILFISSLYNLSFCSCMLMGIFDLAFNRKNSNGIIKSKETTLVHKFPLGFQIRSICPLRNDAFILRFMPN